LTAARCDAYYYTHGIAVPKVETNTRKIVRRLEADGWRNLGGGSHERFVCDDRPGDMIFIPRHREVSPGVARSIARAAGWI
jgi:predicted RNA binding protein YcfA (HicA-like mRNA interferase family)